MKLLALLVILVHLHISSVSSVPEKQIRFFLYTKQFPEGRIPLNRNNLELLRGASRIIFLIHGWIEHSTNQWYSRIRSGYLSRTQQNIHIIEVDWSIQSYLDYVTASIDTSPIGDIIARFILDIRRQIRIPMSRIEIVGFSLGAQISGFVGQYLRSREPAKLRRIVGMDPAGPLFNDAPPDKRLSPDDANMVVVIHADRGVFGYLFACGTIDFFPNNGGPLQPGCLPIQSGCSHFRANVYFSEAVTSGVFYGRQCGSYLEFQAGLCQNNLRINFGQDISPNITGKFYAQTNYRPPFNIPST